MAAIAQDLTIKFSKYMLLMGTFAVNMKLLRNSEHFCVCVCARYKIKHVHLTLQRHPHLHIING